MAHSRRSRPWFLPRHMPSTEEKHAVPCVAGSCYGYCIFDGNSFHAEHPSQKVHLANLHWIFGLLSCHLWYIWNCGGDPHRHMAAVLALVSVANQSPAGISHEVVPDCGGILYAEVDWAVLTVSDPTYLCFVFHMGICGCISYSYRPG